MPTLSPRQVSPGKNVVFPSIYPPHILQPAFRSMDFALLGKLIQLPIASDGVRVPRAGGLPPASFGFYLAVDTLASWLHLLLLSVFGTYTL